ncbi:hypothetical protein LL06_13805 [Hoeflea sp. BAL378]|uniref:hypothetical protein n=1 Tax=Hoeflea sp. BAL378 TaxID=1547437 RepID=UPI0005145A28|nr:hypothetical protein [Hoeflea sp. BAL378]KGF68937.1 hypothetical protein LL06_13805 [Hoeflea sp. BAL378]
MYDREKRFPMEETMNHVRIEYTEKGVMHMASRRCMLRAISRSGAILGIVTQFTIPRQFCLDIPEARIPRIGCVLMRINPNDTIEVRFLRLMTEAELNKVFVFSDHPAHRGRVLDLRAR